jgi:hypothetical protein
MYYLFKQADLMKICIIAAVRPLSDGVSAGGVNYVNHLFADVTMGRVEDVP